MITLDTPIATAADGLNVQLYGRLLARFVPKVIETEAENEVALKLIEALMEKGEDNLTPEEDALFGLVASLIESFESRTYAISEGTPEGALRFLMDSHGLRQIDLAEILGSRGRVSDLLSGRRRISKEQAKKLASRFRVSPAVFI